MPFVLLYQKQLLECGFVPVRVQCKFFKLDVKRHIKFFSKGRYQYISSSSSCSGIVFLTSEVQPSRLAKAYTSAKE